MSVQTVGNRVMQRNLQRRAAKTMEQFKQLKSTPNAEALGTGSFQLPDIYPQALDMARQLDEINGRIPFDKPKQFHCSAYRDLMQTISPLRTGFRNTDDVVARQQIAKEEYEAWRHYVVQRRADVTGMEQFEISPHTHSLLKEQFDRLKRRETLKLPSEKVVDFHAEFAKKFRFKVPIHPRNLAHLVYPYQGYLSSFKGREFSFSEIEGAYENQIIGSMEKTKGRTLLGDELSALSFYELTMEGSDKGYLTFEEMKTLMHAWRFDSIETEQDFLQEFQFALQLSPGEIKRKDLENGEAVFRFDLARSIFLERGL